MPPKRPPPLPRSLFVDNGPLSPGFAPAPSPSTIHPAFITDGHARASGPQLVIPGPGPEVTGAVTVTTSPDAMAVHVGPDGKPSPPKQKVSLATVLGTGPLPEAQMYERAFDLIVPATEPLNADKWERIDEAVDHIDGGRKKVETELAELGDAPTKILISGILPPPLSKPSSALLNSDEFVLYQARSSQLSLHADVVLKALPPVVDVRVAAAGAKDDSRWWEDPKGVERAVKLYIATTIESFGTSRIVFGSQPAVDVKNHPDAEHLVVPIEGAEWYALVRKCIAELGEDQQAMTAVMGSNAAAYYSLETLAT